MRPIAGPRTWITLLAVVLFVSTSAAGGALPAAPSASTASSTPAVVSNATPFIQHVVLIVLENEVLSQVWGHGPYERYLAGTYGNATNFYGACHPSAPNYIAMISGGTHQCGSDNWNNLTTKHLGDDLAAAGRTWANYAENLPKTACANPGGATSGLFATRHTPFLYFADVLANQTFCRQHVLPSKNFTQALATGALANFSFFTPNLCDDGHNGCGGNTTMAQETAQADAWLNGFLSPILNHTGAYNTTAERATLQHTLFIVTWDEGLGSSAGFPVAGIHQYDTYNWCQTHGGKGLAVCGGRVYTAFVSPYSLGRTFALNDSFFGLLRTIEWLFHLPGLGNPGHFDARLGYPAMRSMFSFKSNS